MEKHKAIPKSFMATDEIAKMMDKEKSAAHLICRNTAVIFALLIIVLTVTGWMLGDSQLKYAGLFELGNAGLSFQGIVQIFALSIIIGSLNTLLTSDLVFKKSMLLWRMILMMFLGGVACFIFAVVFRWFPLDMREVWITFGVLFLVTFTVVSLGMVVKTKREDRLNNKAFSEYKSKLRRETI